MSAALTRPWSRQSMRSSTPSAPAATGGVRRGPPGCPGHRCGRPPSVRRWWGIGAHGGIPFHYRGTQAEHSQPGRGFSAGRRGPPRAGQGGPGLLEPRGSLRRRGRKRRRGQGFGGNKASRVDWLARASTRRSQATGPSPRSAAGLPLRSRDSRSCSAACVGLIHMRAQAEAACVRRADTPRAIRLSALPALVSVKEGPR
jgi:hypothetical protein